MKPLEIFTKTMKFCWLKLAIGAANLVISIITFLILVVLIGSNIGGGAFAVCVIIWLGLVRVTSFIINKYIGYLIRVGHISVVVKALTEGELPENQIQYGVDVVKRRFAVANVFFIIDRLVAGAVRQIQRVVNTIGRLIENLPGGKQIVSFINFFVEIAFGSVDDCVLGWVLYREELGAFHGACDGVVLFFQNFKALMLRALKTTFIAVGCMLVIVLIPTLIAAGVGDAMAIIITLFISYYICHIFKKAFLDSYIFIAMMTRYMELATQQEPAVDMYGKCEKWSGKFREIVGKKNEEASGAYAAVPVQNQDPGNFQ